MILTVIMAESKVVANGFIEGYEVVTADEALTDAQCGI
jgi:hypothetical protein